MVNRIKGWFPPNSAELHTPNRIIKWWRFLIPSSTMWPWHLHQSVAPNDLDLDLWVHDLFFIFLVNHFYTAVALRHPWVILDCVRLGFIMVEFGLQAACMAPYHWHFCFSWKSREILICYLKALLTGRWGGPDQLLPIWSGATLLTGNSSNVLCYLLKQCRYSKVSLISSPSISNPCVEVWYGRPYAVTRLSNLTLEGYRERESGT